MGELNPHGFPRQILSLVRLPVPPTAQKSSITVKYKEFT